MVLKPIERNFLGSTNIYFSQCTYLLAGHANWSAHFDNAVLHHHAHHDRISAVEYELWQYLWDGIEKIETENGELDQ